MFVCVLKDLANHRIDMVLLYRVASHESCDEGTTTIPKEIASIKSSPIYLCLYPFLFTNTIKSRLDILFSRVRNNFNLFLIF